MCNVHSTMCNVKCAMQPSQVSSKCVSVESSQVSSSLGHTCARESSATDCTVHCTEKSALTLHQHQQTARRALTAAARSAAQCRTVPCSAAQRRTADSRQQRRHIFATHQPSKQSKASQTDRHGVQGRCKVGVRRKLPRRLLLTAGTPAESIKSVSDKVAETKDTCALINSSSVFPGGVIMIS